MKSYKSVLLAALLYSKRKQLLVQICQSVCWSRGCTVVKRLIGSGCHLWWWVGLVKEC